MRTAKLICFSWNTTGSTAPRLSLHWFQLLSTSSERASIFRWVRASCRMDKWTPRSCRETNTALSMGSSRLLKQYCVTTRAHILQCEIVYSYTNTQFLLSFHFGEQTQRKKERVKTRLCVYYLFGWYCLGGWRYLWNPLDLSAVTNDGMSIAILFKLNVPKVQDTSNYSKEMLIMRDILLENKFRHLQGAVPILSAHARKHISILRHISQTRLFPSLGWTFDFHTSKSFSVKSMIEKALRTIFQSFLSLIENTLAHRP